MRRERGWQGPNLARAPFENQRPIERLAAFLWILALATVALGAWRFHTLERDSGTKAADLERFTAEATSARERATSLQSELERADLVGLNVRTEFLNRRLVERAFSWNRLLDRLTETLPRGVRLRTLTPQAFAKETPRTLRQGSQAAAETRVTLRIDGQAEDTEALLEFVDRLFAHPEFDQPNLSRESEKKDLLIDFDLSVDYLPGASTPTGEPEASPREGQVAAGAEGEGSVAGTVVAKGGAETEGGTGAGADRAAPSDRAVAAGRAAEVPAGSGALSRGVTEKVEEIENRAQRPVVPGPVRSGRAPSRAGASTPPSAEPGGFDREVAEPVGGTPAARTREGASATAAAPRTPAYPYNLIPTPLKPYASSAGGDQ